MVIMSVYANIEIKPEKQVHHNWITSILFDLSMNLTVSKLQLIASIGMHGIVLADKIVYISLHFFMDLSCHMII